MYAARQDPDIDMLWDVWKRLGDEDIDDPEYQESEFVCYERACRAGKGGGEGFVGRCEIGLNIRSCEDCVGETE